MFPSYGVLPTCNEVCKRNDVILQRLRKLNIMSELEGLLQLMNPHYNVLNGDSIIEDSDKRKNCCRALEMLLYLPNIVKQTLLGEKDPDLYTDFIKDSIGLTASVRSEFCWSEGDRRERKLTKESKFLLSKIFVNNISFKTKQRALWDFFEHFGKVLRATIAKDYRTKRSRGFGFVLFASPLAAEKALKTKKIELFLDGRYLKVMPAARKQAGKKKASSMYSARKRLKKVVDEFQNFKIDENDEVVEKDDAGTADDNSKTVMDGMAKVNTTTGRCWTNFPEVIFLRMITYLDLKDRIQLEKVCKSWREFCLSAWPSLKELNFRNIFHMSKSCKVGGLTDEILISIIQKGCYNLRSLDLSGSPYLVDHYGLAFVCKKCIYLQELDLSHVKLRNKTLQLIGKRLTHLKKLQLNHCNSIGEKGLWWLLKDLKKLEHLEMTDNSRVHGKCFLMLAKTLKTAIFSSCTTISDRDGLKYLSGCENLTHLDLSNCLQITQVGLLNIFKNCIQIEHLFLGNTRKVTCFPSLKPLVLLKTLDIRCNTCVNNDTIRNIANNCHMLRVLNMEACHGEMNTNCLQLLGSLPQLQDLNISYITAVDDACLEVFTLEGTLTTLCVRACPQITDSGVISCICNMENLSLFDLSGCQNITGSFIQSEEILRRNERTDNPLKIFLGGTEISVEDMRKLDAVLLNCIVSSLNRAMRDMRNDYDVTFLSRPFFPEETSDDEEGENVDFDDFDLNDRCDDVIQWVEYSEPYDDELPPDVYENGKIPWIRIDADDHEAAITSPQQLEITESDVMMISEEEDWDQEIDDENLQK